MSNPLLAFWHLLVESPEDDEEQRPLPRLPRVRTTQSTETIFLVLRRMRAPLIVLIVIFAVSVLGLSLVPGVDDAGEWHTLGFFNAFYVMSYTATTIGFGEIPYEYSTEQRMWLTFSIYLTVIGWAYAIGSLLALIQDRSFRDALETRRFISKVQHLREPFLLVVGYGQTGSLLARALDERGRRFVVLDSSRQRVDDVEQDGYRADVPAHAGAADDPELLTAAGLGNPRCEGVVAVTNDDDVNLAVTVATSLLRPDLSVIARTSSRGVAARMAEFGDPVVINPYDRFGDRLSLALRAPSAYRLVSWLTATTDGGPPPPLRTPPHGHWLVYGYGRFGREITADLRDEGFDVTVVQPSSGQGGQQASTDPDDADVLADVDLTDVVGLVAATSNDTTNISLVAAARRAKPSLFLVARENLPANAPLYAAMDVDSLLVPTDMVAREALARLAHPLLWELLAEVVTADDAWASRLLDRLVPASGGRTPELWDVQIDTHHAPAVSRRGDPVRIGDLLRDPDDRDHTLDVVPLLLLRDGQRTAWPDGDTELAAGDELLLGGRPRARHVLERVLFDDASLEYVVTGRRVPSGWVWRKVSELSRRPASR
ncbi:NAD-binding protein [Thalassiella azotivora]